MIIYMGVLKQLPYFNMVSALRVEGEMKRIPSYGRPNIGERVCYGSGEREGERRAEKDSKVQYRFVEKLLKTEPGYLHDGWG